MLQNTRTEGVTLKTFEPLPFWACEFTGADDDPTTPPGNGAGGAAGDASGGSGNGGGAPGSAAPNGGDISTLLGDLLGKLDAKTDSEKKLKSELEAAQAVIKAQEDKTLNDQQRAARDNAAALRKAQADADEGVKAVAYAKRIGTLYGIENLKDKDGKPKYTWIDTDVVYAMLDHSKIQFDFEKGEAAGLNEQLDALAKAKPALLKTNQQQQPGSPGGYGTPPSGGNSGDGKENKTLADYAAMPAYRNSFGRLAGLGAQPGYAVQSGQHSNNG